MFIEFYIMKNRILFLVSLMCLTLNAQIDNTMYGLYRTSNPSSFKLAKLNPFTGQITTISNSPVSSLINMAGSSLNPYNQSFTFQDEDSWLTIDLNSGEIISDITFSLPNNEGNIINFRFNAADSTMYGLYAVSNNNPDPGLNSTDIRLAKCDFTTGLISVISPVSIANNYTAVGNAIDPHQMLYYFQSEGKLIGVDLYNGQIFSQPNIILEEQGTYFNNMAYSCVDTTIYGLITQNEIKALAKINPQTGLVTALPTQLSFESLIFNNGGTIDPENLIYYFQTLVGDTTKMVGLSLMDGSVVSISDVSIQGEYFALNQILSECYGVSPTRFNITANAHKINEIKVDVFPNPAHDVLFFKSDTNLDEVEMLDLSGKIIKRFIPNEPNFKCSVDELSDGIYFLKIKTKDANETKTFVKN